MLRPFDSIETTKVINGYAVMCCGEVLYTHGYDYIVILPSGDLLPVKTEHVLKFNYDYVEIPKC